MGFRSSDSTPRIAAIAGIHGCHHKINPLRIKMNQRTENASCHYLHFSVIFNLIFLCHDHYTLPKIVLYSGNLINCSVLFCGFPAWNFWKRIIERMRQKHISSINRFLNSELPPRELFPAITISCSNSFGKMPMNTALSPFYQHDQ